MINQNFPRLYYRATNCLTSDILADFAPVSRVLGVDTSAGMATLFTAMGTRFDFEYVEDEVFMATDNYEADTRSIDDAPVMEVMRYVRGELYKDNKLSVEKRKLVDEIRSGGSIFKNFEKVSAGDKNADVLFLMSPAECGKCASEQFNKLMAKLSKKAYCTNEFGDCGYLKIQLIPFQEQYKEDEALKAELSKYSTVVTDDSYVLDALLMQFEDMADRIFFIDEFIMANADKLDLGKKGKIAVHDCGTIQRLYPERKVCSKCLFANADIVKPARSGFDTTDSGIAGGLGLFYPENMTKLAARRMMDLNALKADVIITSCAEEAVGLNCAEMGEVKTLLQFVTE